MERKEGKGEGEEEVEVVKKGIEENEESLNV
jgi:hypothetical protein